MTTDRPNGSLYTKIESQIATVEFGHPASNSFTLELLNRLTAELDTLSNNVKVTMIVLKSEGENAFCGGASFYELIQLSNLEQGVIVFKGFANVINTCLRCKIVIVSRIPG